MKRKDNENGMVMVEAIYVLVIAILLIFFTMNLGAIYYNRIIVTATANEAASGVAEIYGSAGKEPFYAYTDPQYFKGRDVYRELMPMGMLVENAEQKAKWYASFLTYEDEFTSEKSLDFSDVVVDCSLNDIGVLAITVTITREYPVFITFPAGFWGLDATYKVSATGTAFCYDVIWQMNWTALAKEIENKVDVKFLFTDSMDAVLEIINKIHKAMTQ